MKSDDDGDDFRYRKDKKNNTKGKEKFLFIQQQKIGFLQAGNRMKITKRGATQYDEFSCC